MTYNEIWEAYSKLEPNDQARFMDAARQLVKWNNVNLRAGAKVSFRNSKTGAIISGIFIRMKQKYAEVETNLDKNGLPMPYGTARWSVPPEMLRMVKE